ncbi:protocadherin-16-like [Corythoichthys intestinalis]|uniref:protocadherin-16-like n=1 Tax=Corythoichthys intestinalis TaxID=161448 RepID=UPI0025A58F1A|nr:protocadherin-16-like [Corythoichthys intestinalis]XP_057677237.1 protocadherin-16-like [Corythoichthys intestinalis]XP_061801429.1 protocadherin-16-like [Nerophis lumbriciformis]
MSLRSQESPRRPGGPSFKCLIFLAMVLPASVLGALELQLDEEQPAGTVVGDIGAGLPPGETAGLYFISDHEGTGVGGDLNIDETTGIITTARRLDREQRDRYSFIAVTVTGVTIQVSVTVNDINDHAPQFPKSKVLLKIPEHTVPGTRFSLDPAADADKDQFTTQGYSIREGNVGQVFSLETKRAANKALYLDLVVNGLLDREKRSGYTLVIEAFDGGSPRRVGSMTLEVAVTDVNDHTPVFNQSRYHAVISESLPQGSSILQVFATDQDEGDNGLVLYEINRRQSDPERYFVMDLKSGVITLNRPLDYELKRVHELVVQARDNASHPEVSNAFVTIHVRDYNDNQPTMTIIFLSEDGSPRISEGAQPGQYVARISVTDPDYGEYANVNVSLEGGDGKFALTTKDSIIYLIYVDQELDREERDSYDLRVMATDSGTPPLRAESSFTIRVTDVNDNPPLFDQRAYRQSIPEAVYPGSFVLQVTARDKDQGPNGEVRYSLLKGADSRWDWFSVDPLTGIITTAAALDFESEPSPGVTVVATDGGRPPLSSTARVDVLLQDANDNTPVFSKSFYNATVEENAPVGTCFLQVSATDGDRGSFGAVSYELVSSGAAASALFTVDKESGQLCTSSVIDRDDGPGAFELTVIATDGGGLSSVVTVRVSVADVNDNRPAFYPVLYAVSLSAHSAPGTSVVRVMAHDPDAGENGRVAYQVAPGGGSSFFTLNKDTGVISLSRSLHGKANSIISMVISAQDGGGLRASVDAQVNVSVVGGSVPSPVFEQPQYFFTVSEDVLRGTAVGVVRATTKTALSKDISYSIFSGDPDGYFTVDGLTGTIRTALPLDHETCPRLDLEVQARFGSPPSFGTGRVRISISDVNDNAPKFIPSSSESLLLPEVTKMGTVIYRVQASDEDSGHNGLLSFDLVSTGVAGSSGQRTFAVDRGSGELRLIGALSYESIPRYDLQVVAKDGGAPQLSSTFTLVVHIQAQDAQGPHFDTLTYRVELRENSPLGTRFLQVRALNRDGSGNGGSASSSEISYRLRPDGDAAGFGVAPDSGWLFVRSSLDREVKDMYLLTVVATSGRGGTGRTGSATVRVTLTDENDNSPKLTQDRVFLAVRENLLAGTGFGRVSATDRDAGPNARLSYRLLHADKHFQINSQTGEISTRQALDRERQSSYQLAVVVQDSGTPPRSATGTVHISVLDENDHAPRFTHTRPDQELIFKVKEAIPSGAVLGVVSAKDPDEGENGTVYYTLTGSRAERFSLNAATGELRTAAPLRWEERAEYALTVTAADHGTPSLSSACQLRIQVLSSAKSSPKPNVLSMTLNVVEGALPGSVVGSVHQPEWAVPDGQVTYLVVGGTDRDGTFMVERSKGDVYLVQELDYEKGSEYTLHIEVSDFSRVFPSSHLVKLSIQVQDSNDHSPQFTEDPVTIVIPENLQPGASIYTFRALDKDGSGPNSDVRYSMEHYWPEKAHFLKLDPVSGVLTLGESPDRETSPSLHLVVRATDQAVELSQRRWASVTARVFITDQNDNAPLFCSPAAVSVTEDQPVGFVILHVMARDTDEGENGRVSYRIQSGNGAGRFSLNPITGSLSILKALDREEQEVFNLTVVAEDGGRPSLSTSQLLHVQVMDVNDEAPLFQKTVFETRVLENQGPGTTVLTVAAVDRDHGSNGHVTFGGVTEDGFVINPSTGVITTTKELDKEHRDQYILTVYAQDGGLPPNFAKATVRVEVEDVNDNAPVFSQPWYGLEVPENQAPVELCFLRATDPDSGAGGELEYRITAGDTDGDFHLHASTGALSTQRGLDRETKAEYTLEVTAMDRGSPPLSTAVTVHVRVLDVNDNAPIFGKASYSAEVSEDAAEGSQVLTVSAMDADVDANGKVLYFLSHEAHGAFTVNEHSGQISTSFPLDREKQASYTFLVFATDLSPASPRNSSAQVTITITDINDNAPVFIQDPLVIEVSSKRSQRVLATMKAEDKDFGANGSVFYRFAAPVKGFSINSLTGQIQATEPLDSLSQSQRTLIVEAMDQGTPAQSSQGVVVIYVKEVEYNGIRFSRNARDVSIQENAAKGTAVAQAQAQYPDGNREGISYSIFSGNRQQAFRISSSTGEIWVQSSKVLDFEDTPRLRLVVKAETPSSISFTGINLILQDVNDNLPRFQLQNYVAYMREARGYETPIIQVMAEDVDQGQNGQVTYSIQSSGMSGLFKIDPVTGSITTTAIMDREIFTQTKLVITATDRGSPKLAGSATLTVIIIDQNDNSPTIPLPQEIRISENTLIGTEITLVTGNDVDSGPALAYSLHLDPSATGKFGIHRFTGGVSLTAPLDFEEKTWYTLTVRATDSQHYTEANITILVEDVNDNVPAFTQDLYQVNLPEHTPAGSVVVMVTATDRDSGENGRVTYSVMSSTQEGFYIDPDNGTLFISHQAEFDPERPTVNVVIEARDGGSPPHSALATVQVQIADVNDNAPVFHQSEYRAMVSEDTVPGVTILTFEAFDSDLSRENCGFNFAIANGDDGNAFQMENSVHFLEGRGFQTVGTLLLAEVLDFEVKPMYNLTVVVSDRGVPRRSSSVAAVITIGDVNDNPPVFSRAEYMVALSEGAAAGTEIIRLTATDPDSTPNAEVRYAISSGDEVDLFTVDEWTGALRLQRALDRERQSTHTVVIQATDGQGHFALVPVLVEVKDVNDNHPFFPVEVLTASIRENQPANSAVTVLHAIDHDTGVFGQLRYFMERSHAAKDFSVDSATGEIRSKHPFDFEKMNSFNFVALAVDAGNHSATVTVQVFVTGEDEYDPLFTSSEFSFEVPEDARKGQSIGQVQAHDEDGGVDGIVLYSFPTGSPYFEVNKTTGVIFLKLDSSGSKRGSGSGQGKRESRMMTLDVRAHSPLDASRHATARISIDVTNTGFGLAPDVNILLIIVIAVSLAVIVLLVITATAVFLVKSRRRKKAQNGPNKISVSGTVQKNLDDRGPGQGGERIYHQALPGYGGEQGSGGGPYTRGGSLDPSHSSGRGSAEAAEDDEIRMINEYPRVASVSSSMQEHISARGPDSGIQQDADQLSDVSCEPATLEGSTWFKGKKLGGGLSGTLLSGQLPVYRDEGGGYLGVGRGLNISLPKDYAFPEDGKPQVDGSLTAIVASDEELRGSYNWDYLLNWCPQFQPLANVFTEIARLKDETAQQNPNLRQPFQPKPKTEPKPRIDPPPLITSVAHPGAMSVPPKVPTIGRPFPHLASLRRSPISHEGSISSAAMSPSFSPSLSPLAARSPAVSPFGVSQGPSASLISTREPSLDRSPDHEMRI